MSVPIESSDEALSPPEPTTEASDPASDSSALEVEEPSAPAGLEQGEAMGPVSGESRPDPDLESESDAVSHPETESKPDDDRT